MKKNILLVVCTLLLHATTIFAQSASLIDQLPRHAKSILGNRSPRPENLTEQYRGANCFTGVMYWHNSNLPLIVKVQAELKTELDAKFRQLSAKERPQFGDVIVFYRPDLDIWDHAAIFLNEDFVWNKLGPDRLLFNNDSEKPEFIQPAWTISKFAELQEIYEVSEVIYFRKK